MNAMSRFIQPEKHSGRLLKMADVTAETSFHRATIYRMIARGEFPQRARLSSNRVAWWQSDIEAWKAQRQLVGTEDQQT